MIEFYGHKLLDGILKEGNSILELGNQTMKGNSEFMSESKFKTISKYVDNK